MLSTGAELAALRHWYGFFTPVANYASKFPSFLRVSGSVVTKGTTNMLMIQVEQGLPFFVGDDHEVLCSTPEGETDSIKCFYYGSDDGKEWYTPADANHKNIFPYQIQFNHIIVDATNL